ncbi:hypothetical protein J3R83DRAFT_6934 [Lanmaoa asiatica]|nr:hypothetical protein J3R83DRAFT_6934 [Lanmaoa asiatica]
MNDRELTQWSLLNHLNTLPEADYSYDFFKMTLLRHRIPLVDYQFQDGFFLHAVASLAAGTCGTRNGSPLQILVRSFREEGPMFMFKGWTPAFMRLGPNTVLMFVFFELARPTRAATKAKLVPFVTGMLPIAPSRPASLVDSRVIPNLPAILLTFVYFLAHLLR